MTYRKFKAKTTLSKKGVFRRVNNCPESKDNFYKAFNTSLLVCQSVASLLPLHHPSLSLFLPQSPPEKEDGGDPPGHPLVLVLVLVLALYSTSTSSRRKTWVTHWVTPAMTLCQQQRQVARKKASKRVQRKHSRRRSGTPGVALARFEFWSICSVLQICNGAP